jgi:2-C-methyl-D-erythritol 2,4-cyclodiphosphate synthase
VDALLGALALGDIGQHFPSSDPRWRDAASAAFLRQARDLLAERGWRPGNIDATVVAEQPRLTPHVVAMRARIADELGIALDQVSVKSKTSDGLGFTGREEGVACYAVALIERD